MAEPRIVIFDIESIVDLRAAHRNWCSLSDYWGKTFKTELSSVLCLAYKILGQSKVHCLKAWDYPGWEENINNDKPLLEAFAEVIEGADNIVSHNGIKYDEKFLQTRYLINKMRPMPKVPHIDTCQLLKSNTTFANNRLGHVTKVLDLNTKLENGGWDLWDRIQFGEYTQKDLKLMADYNKQDVVATEALYKVLRPFDKRTVNHNQFEIGNKNICPKCGSTRLKSQGMRHTLTNSYRRYRCIDCHSWSRTDARDLRARAI